MSVTGVQTCALPICGLACLVGIKSGEVAGISIAGQVGVSIRGDCNGITSFIPIPTQIGGVDQPTAGIGEFSYESIPVATDSSAVGLIGIEGGKIGRIGFPGNVSMVISVQVDGLDPVIEIGRASCRERV